MLVDRNFSDLVKEQCSAIRQFKASDAITNRTREAAFGVAKKLRKLDFIDPSQFEEGVKVDIENQQVFISIQEGQPLDQEAIFEAIKSGGYDPIKMTPMDEVARPLEESL